LLLAALGADVAVVSVGEGLEATVEEIESYGRVGHAIRTDLTVPANCRRAVDEAAEALGGLDSVVNAAGGSRVSRRIEEWTPEEWDELVDLNLRVAFFVSQAAIPHMVASGGGAIVSISSSASIAAVPSVLPYGAAKAGINNMTMTMASEVGALGIRVNAIAPGPTRSGRIFRILSAEGRDQDDVQGPGTALGRVADPEEQAWPIVFLLSPAAGYVTGHTLHVNGGQRRTDQQLTTVTQH